MFLLIQIVKVTAESFLFIFNMLQVATIYGIDFLIVCSLLTEISRQFLQTNSLHVPYFECNRILCQINRSSSNFLLYSIYLDCLNLHGNYYLGIYLKC